MRTPLLASLSLLLAGACVSSEPARELPETVVVASDLDNAPFAFVDADGRPAGRDVEMMRRLGAELGLALDWRRMPFEQLLPAVERGDVDVVCATLGITPERAERMLFTRPYFETAIAVVVRTGEGEPGTLADLAGRRVAGGAGTTSERAVRARLPGAAGVFENKSGLDSAARLLAREVDAVAMDGPAADALVAAGDGRLRRLEQDLDAERYALALPRDRGDLRARLDAALAKLERVLERLDRTHGLRGR